MTSTALILGATGGFGGETALALHRHGWQIRALHRNPKAAARALSDMPFIDWVKGDAMNAGDVRAAAVNVDVIVHAVNPPGYRNWGGTVLPMIGNTIAAAKEAGARIVFPGTVYNFGPDVFPLLAETSPQNPKTRKGALRVEMERRLRAASEEGVPVLILRGGDFFGGRNAANNWFAQGLVTPGKRLRSVTYPGPHRVGHNWAYLPDMAETVARLLLCADELKPFEVFHFGGHWLEQGIEMADAVRFAARKPDLPVKRLPWFALTLLSPFVETFREMREMRYLWKKSVKLDNAKLVAFLGHEPHTPLDIAVRATLAGLGCIDMADPSSRPATLSLTEGTIR
ncbi:NAD-dependent epimerase/dehydratase family protein [Parvibaculum sp.]|uniref:NAD-dependent epimerase/dehydratase family protein n=1 Tax=Parvibaculum sp. TaxID=2024848 RepID=UPI0027314680|nr:NAD-dependent epimerase/dehydratase family protein [Parvibaculum sp.]MDP1627417.1 NAD(P)H-binding protein [Parvibaculum sp.]MDP2148596.1 NAD(P)H-binding protein [Parvibaculum sp.]MDP3327553.1 NAD(P)H-binding protein [Parvibaculum sp.]